MPGVVDDIHRLPADLPVPVDDGAAAHLTGMRVPPISLEFDRWTPGHAGGSAWMDGRVLLPAHR